MENIIKVMENDSVKSRKMPERFICVLSLIVFMLVMSVDAAASMYNDYLIKDGGMVGYSSMYIYTSDPHVFEESNTQYVSVITQAVYESGNLYVTQQRKNILGKYKYYAQRYWPKIQTSTVTGSLATFESKSGSYKQILSAYDTGSGDSSDYSGLSMYAQKAWYWDE